MAVSSRQVKNKRDSNGVLTGRPGTVYDVNIKYTAPDGKKKSYAKKGFATKKEATQHEAEMKTKLQNPGQIASITSQRKQTVASYLNDWVESYARVNLRPSTYDGYKKTIANYINPYIGGVALNQLTPAMVDKMFQQIIDKGLKPSTAAGAKRVLSVALSHARKYRYIETNAAKDTLTKFGKSDKTPDPYTPEQVKALMQRVEGTVWEMPVILGGLYGMRRSEILGLRWRNVDLENNTFDVSEQLPFKVPPKTKVIEEMAPPKSNGRTLPITELARPFFLKQFAMQEAQREQAEKDGKGKTYSVVSIHAKAFSGLKKVKKITIGKNVKTIEKMAFYNCKKLKTVQINATNLKRIDKKAFGKVNGKCLIRVKAKKLSKYKKLLSKGGLNKTIKIKTF